MSAANVARAAAAEVAPPLARSRSQWRLAAERFVEHRFAAMSVLLLLALALLSAFAPLISPYDPERTRLLDIYEAPSALHPFGTDSLGRDLATRILYGGRVSLSVGVLAATVAISFGTIVGMVAGYYGRWLDPILMRFVDMMFSLPRLFLLIIFGVFFKGMTLGVIVLVLGLLSWMTTSRLVRAQFLSLKEREFVLAARSVGVPDRRIILRHLLPNSLAPIIVAATLGVASAIISESTLSFLGLGIQPPTPSWGSMLRDATSDMEKAPWLAVFPGLAIFVAVVAINFIGDGLRDAFDPRQ